MLPDTSDNQSIQIPYAVVKLEELARIIKQTINELPSLRKRLDKYKNDKPKAREIYGDLQQQYNRLAATLGSAALLLLEMELSDMANYSVKLKQSIQDFNLMTLDYTKLCSALSNYISKLPILEQSEIKTTNASIIGRLMNNVKLGYYPTDSEHIKYLVRGIEFPEGVTTNLFDPCCGCGLALRTLADRNNCYTYGVELDRYRAEEAQARLHRVGFGSYFHSRISNETFHLMLLNPPYLSVINEGGNNTRSEKRFLVDSLSHLMYGGLLIYIVPYYRLTTDICRVLCDNFTDITMWKFMDSEFKRFKQIAIMGIRQKRCDGSDMVQELSSLVLEPDKLHELSDLPEHRYSLPTTAIKVNLFKGSEFNTHELAEQLKKSASFSKLFEKNRLDSTAKRPLLPLSIGQIGLVGGSGLINGLVECDYPHVLKGRIIKANNTAKEENLNSRGELTSTTLTETRSNKMVFNLLTLNGFVRLGDHKSYNNELPVDNNTICDNNSVKQTNAANTNLILGRTIITAAAQDILTDKDINLALSRHQSGDWGEVSKADWRANDNATKNGERILSAYSSTGGDRFWVITEADRSYTTVLMPDDY